MKIVYLADCPEHLPTVASWIHRQWGDHIPGSTLEATVEWFRTLMQRDALPLTMVAVTEQNVAAGTASLYVHDMMTRMDLSPWLAAVYVPPEQRERGLGSQLVQAVEGAARRLQISRLYLFTPDRERFYARLGWQVLERAEYRGEMNVIMAKAL